MKLFVLDKYEALTIALVVILVCVVAPLGFITSVETAATGSDTLPIYSVETNEKAVCVSFDCAWGAEDIDAVIEALSAADCKATFFVVGSWAEKYPDAVKKLAAAGHEVANHSDAHEHFTSLSTDKMKSSMDACDQKIEKLTGKRPDIFRAPYGEYDENVVSACRDSGRFCIQWDIDSLDWKGLSADEMRGRIIPKLRCGSIILLHTGTESTATALPGILDGIKKAGYSFKTAGELIYREGYIINHEGRQIQTGR